MLTVSNKYTHRESLQHTLQTPSHSCGLHKNGQGSLYVLQTVNTHYRLLTHTLAHLNAFSITSNSGDSTAAHTETNTADTQADTADTQQEQKILSMLLYSLRHN